MSHVSFLLTMYSAYCTDVGNETCGNLIADLLRDYAEKELPLLQIKQELKKISVFLHIGDQNLMATNAKLHIYVNTSENLWHLLNLISLTNIYKKNTKHFCYKQIQV